MATTKRTVKKTPAKDAGSKPGHAASTSSVGMSSAAARENAVIPESRRFHNPNPAEQRGVLDRLAGLHVEGKPIEEWAAGKSEFEIAQMCYAATDEGLEKFQKRVADDAMRLPLGDVANEPFGKSVMERDHFLEEGENDPLLAPDPMGDLIEQHREPGMAYKFLEPQVIERLGMRGYKAVTRANGQPVTMAGMILGKIPERIAKARQQADQQRSEAEIKDVKGKYADSVNRLKSEAEDMGLRVLDPNEMPEREPQDGSGRSVVIE